MLRDPPGSWNPTSTCQTLLQRRPRPFLASDNVGRSFGSQESVCSLTIPFTKRYRIVKEIWVWRRDWCLPRDLPTLWEAKKGRGLLYNNVWHVLVGFQEPRGSRNIKRTSENCLLPFFSTIHRICLHGHPNSSLRLGSLKAELWSRSITTSKSPSNLQ